MRRLYTALTLKSSTFSLRRKTIYFFISILTLFFLASCSHKSGFDSGYKDNGSASLSIKRISAFSIPNDGVQLNLTFSKPVNEKLIRVSETKAGDKLVFIVKGARNEISPSFNKVKERFVEKVDVGADKEGTRVTIELNKPVVYKIDSTVNNVLITMHKKDSKGAVEFYKYKNKLISLGAKKAAIEEVTIYKSGQGAAEIIINSSNENILSTVKHIGKKLQIDFSKANIAPTLQKNINAVNLDTIVKSINTSLVNNNARVVITSVAKFNYLITRFNKKLIIKITPLHLSDLAEMSKEKTRYSGKPLSLNFQSIQVRSLLQLISEFTGLNIVVSDSVKGEMSLHLNNIPWDKALDIILKTQGLAKRRIGDVIVIAPREDIAARELQELQATEKAREFAPLYSEIIHLHYAKAEKFATLLKDKANSLLSSRGKVSVDKRTNTLWVKDTAANIEEIRRLIKRLDIPVKQVLIEARIVSVDTSYEKQIGVRFGLTEAKHMTGTLSGANEMLKAGSPSGVEKVADRLNFNLPATAVGGANPATIGLALFKIANDTYLDLELSALEKEGLGHIISSPRIVASNQQAATIETGEEIPYQEATSSGATNTAFKKAVLSLKITPQITPHNKIILDLKVNEDQRGEALYTNGPPAIKTQALETQVLLSNGDTIVLGGVYKQDKSNVVERVPFFGDIPIIGALFRHKAEHNKRNELLIFVTPMIIDTNT